jgi:integrase
LRSHATKKIYKAYLTRWIRPHWKKYQLAEVRTIQVESWLRGLPLAKSSCAKIRNVMSVLFNHACRYELFDRNPIYLVRQSAKRRTPPATLVPRNQGANRRPGTSRTHTSSSCGFHRAAAERDIRLKVGPYRLRGRHDEHHTFHRVRSGRAVQDRSSQKPVPMHPTLADALMQWRKHCTYIKPEDSVFASKRYRGRRPYWDRRSCANIYARRHNEPEFRSDSDGIRSGTPTRHCCEAWGLSSR